MASFRTWRDDLRTGLRDGVLPHGLTMPEMPGGTVLATTAPAPAAPRTSHGALAR